jgi:hypothetical protein
MGVEPFKVSPVFDRNKVSTFYRSISKFKWELQAPVIRASSEVGR